MKTEISLNGSWQLYYHDTLSSSAADHHDYPCVPAAVPGNVELDLIRVGILPEDEFKGMNTTLTAKFESYEWWYETSFETPELMGDQRAVLVFDGVDTLAEYSLNGRVFGHSDNFFIAHEFDVTDLLQKGTNTLCVHLDSCVAWQMDQKYEPYLSYVWTIGGGTYLRKPAHSFGWDIFPRIVSAGLWKSVHLSIRDAYLFQDYGYFVSLDEKKQPTLQFYANLDVPKKDLFEGKIKVRALGKCGTDSSFEGEVSAWHTKSVKFTAQIDQPKLWWPKRYGEPNIYDTVLQIVREENADGTKRNEAGNIAGNEAVREEVLEEVRLNVGLRTVELDRTDSLTDEDPHFQFIVNGEKIMCLGSNWVPMDAYHSRDIDRYARALEEVSDIGCNMLRVWGGGVYEQEPFYDYCDRHGIMVWQDFMMACQAVPMDEAFMKGLETEFTWVITHLRHHPSIVLWAGDNEIDEAYAGNGVTTAINSITRELLPKLVLRYDAFRPYLPSSPYLPPAYFADYRDHKDLFVERHLWGARDYFKADYYRNSKACFVSETGYHGCPAIESLKKIVDEDALWPIYNEQWTLHSSDQKGSDHRVHLMDDQIKQLFGFYADNLEDFVLASQISQAEAKKYFIERIRADRPYKTGVIWWNLQDGWPQMSDAVVDYFYNKKLAYDYIKRAQVPVCLLIDEMHDWHYTLKVSNDTLEAASGTYKVTDIETGECFAQGAFEAGPGVSTALASIRMMYTDHRMLLIEWQIGDRRFINHYLCGYPPFDFARYRKWLAKLDAAAQEAGK